MAQPPAYPENEVQRLESLSAYQVQDTIPELAFDDPTFLAGTISQTPIALISLLADQRQWCQLKGWDLGERDLQGRGVLRTLHPAIGRHGGV